MDGNTPMASARVDDWLKPISESNPAGQDPYSSSVHEGLRAQLNGLDAIDWQKFLGDAETLVAKKAKDLTIASYLAYGLLQTEGLAGLSDGVALVSGILDHYWDTCFPESKRGRGGAIEWLVERVAASITDAPSTTDSEVSRLLDQVSRLETVASTRFDNPEVAGNIERLRQLLHEMPTHEGGSPADSGNGEGSSGAGNEANEARGTPAVRSKFDELVDLFSQPIPGDSPAGADLASTAEYEAIKDEAGKWNRAAHAENVDWESIRDQSRELLLKGSKDFRLACHFGIAAFQTDGLSGLIEGVAAITALFERYWDDGYPQRTRARMGFLSMFRERVETIGDLVPTPSQEEEVRILGDAVRRLNSHWEERLDSNLEDLRDAVEKLQLTVDALKGRDEDVDRPDQGGDDQGGDRSKTGVEEQGTGATPTAGPAKDKPRPAVKPPKAAPAPSDAGDVVSFLRETGNALYGVSKLLFQASPESPLSYRLCRSGLYMHFERAPVATNGNQTNVAAPTGDPASKLEQLVASGNWDALLTEAESALGTSRMWFDLHRYTWMALAGLGYDEAKDTVLSETAGVVRRLPGLLGLTFSDGSALASQATREWLGQATLAGSSEASSSGQGGGVFGEQLDAARQQALGGDLAKAMEMFTDVVDSTEATGRDRFQAKLAMASACSSAGSHALAEGILAALGPEIERFALERWEPDLAIACYRSRYEALLAISSKGAKMQAELVEVYRQLCRVDPTAALNLKSPPV